MWVIETLQDGQAIAWELSKRVPRNAAGDPVESGHLDDNRIVVPGKTDLVSMTAFLKERSDDHVRVGDVESAWKAAEASGSQRERTVKRHDVTAAQVLKPPRPGAPIVVPNSKSPSSPITGVIVLLLLAAAAYFIFIRGAS